MDAEEVQRRLVAARALADVDQKDLGPKLKDEGFGKEDIGRIERGELTLTRGRRVVIADLLGVPEWWFTTADLQGYLRSLPPPPEEGEAGPEDPDAPLHELDRRRPRPPHGGAKDEERRSTGR